MSEKNSDHSKKIHRICLPAADKFIIIPPEMLSVLIRRSRNADRTSILLTDFFSEELLIYLKEVLNVNRHLPLFPCSYRFGGSPNAGGTDHIYSILSAQLVRLTLDKNPFFQKVEYKNDPQNGESLLTEYAPYTLDICRREETFLYKTGKRNIVILLRESL